MNSPEGAVEINPADSELLQGRWRICEERLEHRGWERVAVHAFLESDGCNPRRRIPSKGDGVVHQAFPTIGGYGDRACFAVLGYPREDNPYVGAFVERELELDVDGLSGVQSPQDVFVSREVFMLGKVYGVGGEVPP